jgi:hypothetical protein
MKKILYGLMGLAMFLTSCQTMENRDELGPVLTKDQLKIAIVQPTAGSNSVILQNLTPGAIMYWDWGTGTSHRAIDTIYIPFAGTFTLNYTAFCAGGTVSDSKTFTVAKNDDAFFDKDPAWKGLTNGGPGQTWVWALDIPGGIIAGNGPENCPAPAWWTMDASAGNSWINFNDSVRIDLKGAANFKCIHKDGSVTKGFFNVIAPYVNGGVTYSGIQTLNGVTFPWPNPSDGKYHFTKMTANELSVHEYAAFNVALYKRKGFTY